MGTSWRLPVAAAAVATVLTLAWWRAQSVPDVPLIETASSPYFDSEHSQHYDYYYGWPEGDIALPIPPRHATTGGADTAPATVGSTATMHRSEPHRRPASPAQREYVWQFNSMPFVQRRDAWKACAAAEDRMATIRNKLGEYQDAWLVGTPAERKQIMARSRALSEETTHLLQLLELRNYHIDKRSFTLAHR